METERELKTQNILIGERVRKLRENLRISRKEFAEIIGVAENTLISIELGARGISVDTLIKLAKSLYTTADYLLFGKTGYEDITSIEAIASTLEPELLEGLEYQFKSYLVAVDLLRKQKLEETEDEK